MTGLTNGTSASEQLLLPRRHLRRHGGLQPQNLATNASGEVYVAGLGNNRIQEFAAAPPTTTISSGPADPASDNTPSFGFATSQSDPLNTSFGCRLDAQPFASCISPFTATTLPDGPPQLQGPRHRQ